MGGSVKVLRLLRGYWKRMLGVISATILVTSLFWTWSVQSGAGRTCDIPLQQVSESNFSYMQVELTEQDPVEPVFRGALSYLLVHDPRVRVLEIFTTGGQGYGNTGVSGGVLRTANGKYMVGPIQGYVLNPISGSHRLFPFDSANFDFVVATLPKVSYSLVSIINRVEGFVLSCSDVSATLIRDEQIQVRVKLQRNPILQLTSIVITLAAVAFAWLICRSTKTEALAAAAGAAFFSLWSVRSILGSQIHVFPTVLDLVILTASILFLAAVIWRTVLSIISRAK